MITATGNNFGAGMIQLKDYQSDKMIILNGRVPLNPSHADYEAAQQLEIYVPDLKLPKSTTTAVFLHGLSWEKKYVTAVRSWIKNKNTILLEKPPIFRNVSSSPVLDFLCAYVPKGVRFDIQDMQVTTLAIADSTSENAQIRYQQCFITDNWVSLAIQLQGFRGENEGDPFSLRLTGLPSDLNIDVPFFFNSHTYSYPGSFEIPITIQGDQLSCAGVSGVHHSGGYTIETKVFIVR